MESFGLNSPDGHRVDGDVFLRWVGRKLGVQFESQDFGFVNAAPERVVEFAAFFAAWHDRVPEEVRELFLYEVGELVIESALQAAAIRDLNPAEQQALQQVWACVRTHHIARIKSAELQRGAGGNVAAAARVLACIRVVGDPMEPGGADV